MEKTINNLRDLKHFLDLLDEDQLQQPIKVFIWDEPEPYEITCANIAEHDTWAEGKDVEGSYVGSLESIKNEFPELDLNNLKNILSKGTISFDNILRK